MTLPDDQERFSYCIRELVKSLPETKKSISELTGISIAAINNFLSSKVTLEQSDLQNLVNYFNCTSEVGRDHDGNEFHDFRLSGGYTVLPKGRRRIVSLYDSVSNGGDLVFAYQLVHSGGYKTDDTRYILLHTCYYHYTLMIIKEQADLVDQLIESGALINFRGDRVACQELFHELDNHDYRIAREPDNRRKLDQDFFHNKELTFAQLAPSYVTVN